MKLFRGWSFAVSFATAVVVCGCGKSEHRAEVNHAEHNADHEQETVTYKEGKGLYVPSRTAQFIGLKVEDVQEQPIRTVTKFDARVYRPAKGQTFASMETAGPARALASGQLRRAESRAVTAGKIVEVRASSGSVLKGQITKVDETLGTRSDTAEVLVAITDSAAELAQGAFVTVTMSNDAKRPVLTVPESAVLITAEGKFVYTVSGDHLVRTAVKTGALDAHSVEVSDGLYAGDQVVTEPVMTLWMAELQAIRGGASCADGH